jgi:hypothetical protein
MTHEPRDPTLLDASFNRVGRERIRTPASSSMAAQWTGFLLAPVAFFAHLQVAYVLVPLACATGNHLWLHLAGALSVLLAIAGTVIAWGVWTRDGGGAPGEHGGPSPRARFLGLTGAVMGAMFTLLLAAQWAAAFILSPCQ